MSSPSGKDNGDSWASIFSSLTSIGSPSGQISSDPFSLLATGGATSPSGIQGVSPTGRNMALFDPESAYRMMSLINNDEVLYKAQFSELRQMQSSVSRMHEAGQRMENIALSTDNGSIKAQLQDFLAQYNDWIQRFTSDIRQGGLLADTQAAQASRFELEQNVNNHFFGISNSVHGMQDLGFTIDPVSHLASLDGTKLDSLLASNKQGAVNTVREFSNNFAKSADLLNSDGNFILKQLANLNGAIHFIDTNKNSLQAEFGTGDAAKPSGQVAQALQAYNQTLQT